MVLINKGTRRTGKFKGVELNWLHPHHASLKQNNSQLVFGNNIYTVLIDIFQHYVQVVFFDIQSGESVHSQTYKDMNDFLGYWNILDRRVLIEKKYCL